MTPKCHACPIVGECRSYDHLCHRYAENPQRYRAIVDSVNGEPPAPPAPSRVALADSLRATRLGFHRCWFSTKDSECGCSGVRCHLLKRTVTLADCVACLSSDKMN